MMRWCVFKPVCVCRSWLHGGERVFKGCALQQVQWCTCGQLHRMCWQYCLSAGWLAVLQKARQSVIHV
jgi:hypothetical protein